MLWVGLIDELWDQLGGLVSPEREPWLFAASASMGEARARTFVTGRALLKYALIELGALGTHDALPELTVNTHGRPGLPPSLGLDFNLSHSAGLMALALGPGPQGVDLELSYPDLRRPSLSLAQRVLGPAELAQWHTLFAPVAAELEPLPAGKRGQSSADLMLLSDRARAALSAACFYFKRQWTLREAMVKLIGSSIFALEHLVVDEAARRCGFRVTSSGADELVAGSAALLTMLQGKTLPSGYMVSGVLPPLWDLSAERALKNDYARAQARFCFSLFCPDDQGAPGAAAPEPLEPPLTLQALIQGRFEPVVVPKMQHLALVLC